MWEFDVPLKPFYMEIQNLNDHEIKFIIGLKGLPPSFYVFSIRLLLNRL